MNFTTNIWHPLKFGQLKIQLNSKQTSVQAGAVLMPLAMFLLSLKSIRVLY